MKTSWILIVISFFLLKQSNAQIEWTGPTITISKASNADWTLEENQDRITPNVWLTRQNNQLLYNIAVNENPPDIDSLPVDTEWALGTIADGVENLIFDEFLEIVVDDEGDACPPCGLNTGYVLHLITDDIYIDFKLTSWNEETTPPPGDNQGGFGVPGGQFTYERSTDESVNTNEFELAKDIQIFPNPSNHFIHIMGLLNTENYKIYDILGAEITSGYISNNETINIKNLTEGLYLLKLGEEQSIKFMKK